MNSCRVVVQQLESVTLMRVACLWIVHYVYLPSTTSHKLGIYVHSGLCQQRPDCQNPACNARQDYMQVLFPLTLLMWISKFHIILFSHVVKGITVVTMDTASMARINANPKGWLCWIYTVVLHGKFPGIPSTVHTGKYLIIPLFFFEQNVFLQQPPSSQYSHTIQLFISKFKLKFKNIKQHFA